ncbi:Crp/Fnr family transcriptional regulator [Brevibacillus sp. Leaf182]|uniref:Crp/Fnr family transcriptional regulator n=1 Tax=Brevibacillus sp. Leaf182 TaxID=1736290 RepID=UPI000A46FF5B|nr:Crp/Fnr family transcriptional regulator [Brevibacillus sp. Leaf182]
MNEPIKHEGMGEQIVLAKKTVFQTPADTRMGIFFIQKGLLRFSRLNEDGKSFTVGLLGPGAVFGEIEEMVLGSRAVYIEAMQKTTLTHWSATRMVEMLQACPPDLKEMMFQLSKRLAEQEERMEKLALESVRDRVLHLLVQLCQRFGKVEEPFWKLTVSLSHQEIANMVGATRETVSLALASLVDEGMVLVSRMSIAVHASRMVDKKRECK